VDYNVGLVALAIGLGMAIAAAIGALSQSRAIAGSVEAIARQPEAGGRIFTSMIIGLALIETLVLFTFLVTGIILKGDLSKIVQANYGKNNVEAQKLMDNYESEKAKAGGGH